MVGTAPLARSAGTPPAGGGRRGRKKNDLSSTQAVEQEIREIAERAAAAAGVAVYDVVYRRTGPRWKVQIFLWREGAPVSLEDCEKVSRQVSRELDVEDPIPHRYDLEVSSPGLERPLRAAWHWSRAVGEKVRVRFRDESGRARTTIAVLESVDEDAEAITLAGPQDEPFALSLGSILAARIHVEW